MQNLYDKYIEVSCNEKLSDWQIHCELKKHLNLLKKISTIKPK